ncbi:hypothetical protein [Dyella silvatica]|uniref:hypothetical protein n=1 Tax=Dyella silvatica TaxID=2992128 RepID=UPI002256B7F4|nr:hypothetical protein [Dyella silvatica]
MKTSHLFNHAMRLSLFLASGTAIATECPYHPLDPGTGTVSVGPATVHFGAGDHAEKPSAWIGPLRITQPGGTSCTVDPDVSIMERPMYSDGEHMLVSTYSGSLRIVYAIDLATCAVVWKSDAFAGALALHGQQLHMAKHVVKLGPHCVP